MTAYFVVNYRITNPDGYQKYRELAGATVTAHGGEVVVADWASEPVEGAPAPVTIVIRFDSKEAFRGWYDSPEYQAALPHRLDNTEGHSVLCDGIAGPA
jgi:uncharacterized protein (DUF1330 family)